MNIKVERVSEELIKPSSPTPIHLRHLDLSFLDQIQPHLFIPVICFYRNKSKFSKLDFCALLKKSLSKALTIFYPVAGRVNNNSYVDCNDQGILFVEAKVNCQLDHVLREHIPSNNNYFIPSTLNEYGDLGAFSQITFFSCGGIAISFAMSHKIGDGISMLTFLKTWTAIARENTDIINDVHRVGSATLFPALEDMSWFGIDDLQAKLMEEKIATKLFAFDSFAIAALKAKYTSNSKGRISDAMIVAGFICSRFMAMMQNKSQKYRVMQGVNLRIRVNPPISMLSFGNYSISEPLIEGNVNDEGDGWFEAVKRMAESTKKVNAEYIKNLQNKDGQSKFLKKINPEYMNKEDVACFTFSNIQGFPLYEIDFGLGKPLWVALTPLALKNMVFLFPTNDGLGIEAWVYLNEDDMTKFEMDHMLLQHVSIPTMKLDTY